MPTFRAECSGEDNEIMVGFAAVALPVPSTPQDACKARRGIAPMCALLKKRAVEKSCVKTVGPLINFGEQGAAGLVGAMPSTCPDGYALLRWNAVKDHRAW